MPRAMTIDIETRPAPVESEIQEADYLKTALNGNYGQILCIGFIDDVPGRRPEYGVFGWDEERELLTGDEGEILTAFWGRLRNFRAGTDRIVGHNIFDFDLKFIIKRSIILGVRPTVDFSFARYRNQPVFDTMHEWEKWSFGNRISLDALAKVLNLSSSKANGVDGSKVWELYQTGQHREIRDYCFNDVKLTRNIYRRMIFAESQNQIRNVPLSEMSAAPINAETVSNITYRTAG
jgi:3'-5' exonuclease